MTTALAHMDKNRSAGRSLRSNNFQEEEEEKSSRICRANTPAQQGICARHIRR